MQTLVEDFLQYLRHERGQPAAFWSRRGINAETRRPQKFAEVERTSALADIETTLRFSAAFAPPRFSGLSFQVVCAHFLFAIRAGRSKV
jgi:hypothetical protein